MLKFNNIFNLKYNMGKYNFKDDISTGEKGEEIVRTILVDNGMTFINDNKNAFYDLKLLSKENKEILFEIKTDEYCTPENDTGNLFIEFECRGKKSGITTTKADYFVYYYAYLNEMWIIKTSKIIELIEYYSFRSVNNAGDKGSNTKAYLFPRRKFSEFFKVVEVDYKWP